MLESPYTKYRAHTFNGPNNSSDYNDRVEENYRDLVVLYNKLHQIDEKYNSSFVNIVKDMISITNRLDRIESGLDEYVGGTTNGWGSLSFGGKSDHVDTNRFNSTQFEVPNVDRLSDSAFYPGLFLPPAGASSPFTSAISFTDSGFVPDSVETHVSGSVGTADSVGAVISTTQPELSFNRSSGPNWERNVVTTSLHPNGAVMTLYVSVPIDVSPYTKCNYIKLNPYPIYSVDIMSVEYTTKVDVTLSDSDEYTPVNYAGLYAGYDAAVGKIPPGGWSGDTDEMAGNRLWLFEPVEATAFKITFRQRNYYNEAGSYVYSYGANNIDVGFLKTLDEGRIILRYDAPTGQTISNIDNVMPRIYNMSGAFLSEVFDYRVIWETAYDSGTYTLSPVPLSNRVWIEITLRRNSNGVIPMMTGLDVIST